MSDIVVNAAHPDFDESLAKEYYEKLKSARRLELAEKVQSGRLSKTEKEEVYEILTGNSGDCKGAGRPRTTDRDQAFVFDLLLKVLKRGKSSPRDKSELIEKYKIPAADNAFYTAHKRGLKLLSEKLPLNIEELEASSTKRLDDELEARRKRLLKISQQILSLVEYCQDGGALHKIDWNKLTAK